VSTLDEQLTAAIEKLKRSHKFKAAEKRLDYWAVMLIGPEERVPRRFGDNAGVFDVRVAASSDPEGYLRRHQIEHGVHRRQIVALVWTESAAHAKRLKDKLDELLAGTAAGLLGNWRDIDGDPDVTWQILLAQALREIEARGETIEVFGEQERLARVAQEAGRLVPGRQRA
jgi:hypothetical protein